MPRLKFHQSMPTEKIYLNKICKYCALIHDNPEKYGCDYKFELW